MSYAYAEHTGRNAGFVTVAEQARLRSASVFVCGVGGMGGAAVETLARVGVGHLVIADMDRFEISNLNRQGFAWTDTVGREKTEVVADALMRINPELQVNTLGADWVAAETTVIDGADHFFSGAAGRIAEIATAVAQRR